MQRLILLLALVLSAWESSAWNALGHQLVAQIAYDNLNPETKKSCDRYNKSLNKVFRGGGFVHASAWLDTIRSKDVHWFDSYHYIDLPFTKDDMPLPVTPEINGLWAIKQAMIVLNSKRSSTADKGFALRVLTHVIADIHQPLHTISLYSKEHPKGDLGGNLFQLGKNPIASNLHHYWDTGAGILMGQAKPFQIRNKAQQLESKWSCQQANAQKKPEQWVKSANYLAKTQAYNIEQGAIPSKRYQLNTQNISQKQILFAGCRLASLLNSINTA